jgi:Ran GTPase-activating protein (RanGAP) involved in mRNA processing and transport
MRSTTLNLSHKSLTPVELSQLLETWKISLSEHAISSGSHCDEYSVLLGFNKLGNEGVKIIADFLSSDKTVTCLDLCFNSFGSAGARYLAASLLRNQSLKSLSLSGNLLGPKGFQWIGKALSLNTTLTSLNMTGDSGTAAGATYLFDQLKANACLESLCLNGNSLEIVGMSAIGGLLTSPTCNIRHLRIGDNNIGDYGLSYLSECLPHYRKLRLIQLSFNDITCEGMKTFSDSLKEYSALESLELDNNKIGDEGVRKLVEILPSLNLKSLNIGFNDIGNDGISSLFKALTPNRTLKHLVISGCTITAESAVRISEMLKVNEKLTDLYLDNVTISPAGENNIAAGIAHNQNCPLVNFSGFHLGTALVRLGSPTANVGMTNGQALESLRASWALQKQKLSPVVRTQSFGKIVGGPSTGSFQGLKVCEAASEVQVGHTGQVLTTRASYFSSLQALSIVVSADSEGIESRALTFGNNAGPSISSSPHAWGGTHSLSNSLTPNSFSLMAHPRLHQPQPSGRSSEASVEETNAAGDDRTSDLSTNSIVASSDDSKVAAEVPRLAQRLSITTLSSFNNASPNLRSSTGFTKLERKASFRQDMRPPALTIPSLDESVAPNQPTPVNSELISFVVVCSRLLVLKR